MFVDLKFELDWNCQKNKQTIGVLYLDDRTSAVKTKESQTTAAVSDLSVLTVSPVWSPHTPERRARCKAAPPQQRARPGSRSSAPQQTGRGRQSKTRCSSKTWPAESCAGRSVWTRRPETPGAAGWRQKGHCGQRKLEVFMFNWLFFSSDIWETFFFLSPNREVGHLLSVN